MGFCFPLDCCPLSIGREQVSLWSLVCNGSVRRSTLGRPLTDGGMESEVGWYGRDVFFVRRPESRVTNDSRTNRPSTRE